MTGINRIAFVLFLVLFSIEPRRVEAIVVRHDRDEQVFIALARQFPATVTFYLSAPQRGFSGMGTLIDSRWVLTAAHVAEYLKPGALAEVGGTRYEIEAIIKHPGWRGFETWDGMRSDLALVSLRTAVKNVVPAQLYDGSDELGMSVTFVGRGGYGTGLTGPIKTSSTMRAATNRVEKAEGPYLRFRFDAPDDPDVTELEGICGDGDSGNAAYIERDGAYYIIGVGSAQDARPTENKDGRYGVLEYFPRVSHFAGWIREMVRSRPAGISTPDK